MIKNLHSSIYTMAATTMLFSASHTVGAKTEITFRDIATEQSSGIHYRRVESPRNAIFDSLKTKSIFTMNDAVNVPIKARGAPGIAILDYDGDGDLDLYVTNGPNTQNSLYSNQFKETGDITFVDQGEFAGVGAFDQDSNGVCFGDIDNDGDHDLLVLGSGDPNRLFENQGDGTFTDITSLSGIGLDSRHSSSCSMGDVNSDGLLDIVIGNSTTNWDSMIPIVVEPFALNEHNQLFLNSPGNIFTDESQTSGILDLKGFPTGFEGAPSITWSIAMVDFDLDGDIDIIQGDDQGFVPPDVIGGVDRGLIHILQNDGLGYFTDVTVDVSMNNQGAWMGLSFGDVNSDGFLDIFGSNGGDYYPTFIEEPPYPLGATTSRWFLGQPDGTFDDPGVGDLVATPFGWGTSMTDYDNDGDTDIIFHGGLDQGLWIDASNPGVILQNDGVGNFTYDVNALQSSTNHARRNVQGMAVGDLNNDGFTDIVSVSNFDSLEPIPLIPYSVTYGSPFDTFANFVSPFESTGVPNEFRWRGIEFPDGTLSIDLNSASNANKWVEIRVKGTIGITVDGQVNRDGIGAVVSFTPNKGNTVMHPILGGSSYASQNSLAANFGLGDASSGTVEVLWPGGIRNRLYHVRHSERIVFPEIPCSFDETWRSIRQYYRCVSTSVRQLVRAGEINKRDQYKFFISALRAYLEEKWAVR